MRRACRRWPYDQNFTFAARSGAIGRWYEADTGTGPQLPQITAGRPVAARAEIDVTAAAAPTTRCCPRTAQSSADCARARSSANFDAAFSRPTLDNAAGEPEAVNSVAAFPTRLAGVTTASDTQGLIGPDGVAQRQQLVLIPGQFTTVLPDDPDGRGTQVLFDRMSGDVYYSASTDWTAPTVGEVELSTRRRATTSADVSVDGRRRLGDPSGRRAVPGRRRLANARPPCRRRAFGGTLAVPAAIANEQIRVVVQVVDGAGNVSWAANKGPGFTPTPPPPPAPTVTVAPVPPASGWFTTAPQITVHGCARCKLLGVDRRWSG